MRKPPTWKGHAELLPLAVLVLQVPGPAPDRLSKQINIKTIPVPGHQATSRLRLSPLASEITRTPDPESMSTYDGELYLNPVLLENSNGQHTSPFCVLENFFFFVDIFFFFLVCFVCLPSAVNQLLPVTRPDTDPPKSFSLSDK